MSIPTPFNPLGTLGGRQWYNWAAEVWTTRHGGTAYSSEYIITDFIPVALGSLEFAGVGVNAESYNSLVMLVYKADGSYADFWGFPDVPEGQPGSRRVTIKNNGAYVRIQTTRALYREAYVIQNGVYLFKGEDNPPKPL